MKLFDEIPYLEDERIILKKAEEKDSDAIEQISSDESIRRYMPASLFDYGFSDKKEAVREMYAKPFENRELLFLGVYQKSAPDTMVGLAEVYNYDVDWSKASISYRLCGQYQNSGIAENVVKLLTNYLLNETDIRRVTAHVMSEDEDTNRVLSLCGFRMRRLRAKKDWGYSEPVTVNKYIIEKFGNISYAKIGNGAKPMVILPGIALKSTLGAADAIAQLFADFSDYTIYLMDDRQAVDEGYTLRKRAGDVAALMKTLSIKDACIYGASMGGMVAQLLAIDHPKLVRKMVIASTSSKLDDSAKAVLQGWIDNAQKDNLRQLIRQMNEKIFSPATIEQYGEFLEKNVGPVSDEELAKFIILAKAVLAHNSFDELGKVRCPVLVVGSEGDMVLGCEASRLIADTLGCEKHIYGKEFGHGVYDEAPDFKQRMFEFFEKD